MTVEFDPTRYEVQIDPYPHYQRLRDEAPVYWIEALKAFALTRYEDCKNTFLHPERYSARDFIAQAFGDLDPVPEVPSIIAMDPPEHTPVRKLAAQGFRPALIRGLEPEIYRIVDSLLDDVERSGRSFDFVHDFAAYVPVSVAAELLGVDRGQREHFKIWTADLLKAANRASLPDSEVETIRASVAQLRAYLEDEIAKRRRSPSNDFLSLLVKSEEEGDTLSPTQVLSIAILTHFGGSETPSHLISSSLIALFENSGLLEQVRDEPGLIPKLVEETLRFWSPVHLVFQTAAQDIELHNVKIPEGSYVLSYISSANRDERFFADPDRFDIDRDTRGHLSFSHGPHFCPGAGLGRRSAPAPCERTSSRSTKARRTPRAT